MAEIDYTGKQLAGYRVLRKLGQGGMATVYKAHEDSLNRVVALKVIGIHLSENAQFIERFKREAQAAAQLSHPNIVQVYAIGEEDGVHFFAMEYVKGHSLREIIADEGFLTAARAVPILEQVCEALVVAHDAGIVHRDIKPANIMIDETGRARVADFGIAQMITKDRLTQSGMMIGTPEYISPEQCRGEKLDGRSDLYALGVTFFQMLSGRTPFQADTPAELVLQIIEGPSCTVGTFNPTVPAGVQSIVEKMMCVEPKSRFQSAEDLLHALRDVDTGPTTTTVQVGGAAAAADPQPEPPGPTELVDSDAAEPAPAATQVQPRATAVTEVQQPAKAAPPAATEIQPPPEAEPPTPAESEKAPAADPSPATAAYAGGDKKSNPLIPIGAMVVVVLALALVAWQFWPQGGPGEDAGTLVADTSGAANTENTEEATDNASAGVDNLAIGTDDGADPAAAENREPPSSEAGAETATRDRGGATGAGTDDPPARAAATGGGTPRQAAPASTDPSANQAEEPPPPAEPEFIPPPINSIVADTSGEYEYVDLVHTWIEGVLGDQNFEIVDYPSSPYNNIQEAARFHVVSTAKLVSVRQLEYFGRVQPQYTVALTMRITDLANGVTVAGPANTTIQYTDINFTENLEKGTTDLARRLARQLRQRIQVP